ncbi:Xaa-Pro aminopeptidase 3 [Halotydeus destructor]|nr:Xaa-Pro aminopeptidase 3 [Halotydeus destructor]
MIRYTVKRCSTFSPAIFKRNLCSSLANESSNYVRKCKEQIRNPFDSLISSSEYQERQLKLVELVKRKYGSKSCLLLVPSSERTYQADTIIPTINFKQNSEFTYLTGLNTYEACGSILVIAVDENTTKRTLFTPKLSPHQVLWEGHGVLASKSLDHFQTICTSISDVNELDRFLMDSLNDQILVSKSALSASSQSKSRMSNVLAKTGLNELKDNVSELSPLIDELKLIKSKDELTAMKRAGDIGAIAMKSTIDWANAELRCTESDRVGLRESQIGAKFDYETRSNGAIQAGYPSVCAGSDRSTVIHYGTNDRYVSYDEWILMDAGCEDVDGYNSDITRTWPVSGHPAKDRLRQALYEALCEVHLELIKAVYQQVNTLDGLFDYMCRLLGKVLIEFGIIPRTASPSEASRLAYKFCPHHVSHFLGLDIHDTPTVSRSVQLKPGMCFTIEPGLYFRSNDNVNKEFVGIGLRVEDDLCIELDSSVTLMTSACPIVNDTPRIE